MKRYQMTIVSLLLVVLLLAGCGASAQAQQIRIGALKGPTTIGLVKMLSDDAAKGEESSLEFTLAGTADELTPKLINGELDMVAVPANLASVLYNNTDGAVQVLAINTLGVLSIVVKNEEITSIADLKGHEIYATGKGTTPEYSLRYLLMQNGLDPDKDVTITFKSEATEIASLLAEEEQAIAMLPQPYVTSVLASVEGVSIALDLTEEWDALGQEGRLITGVLVARTEFVKEHPEAVQEFLKNYETSAAFANEQVAQTAQLCEEYGVIKAAIAEKAIPKCNITLITGDEMKKDLSAYLQILYDQNPKAVGGTMPEDDFYYVQ